MAWTDKVFAYCERGLDPGFWAEPLNALSNGSFFAAALVGLILWLRAPAGQRDMVRLALIVMVGLIGIGSFLFHTLATRWAAVADTVPIGLFMVTYVAFALSRFLKLGWALTGLGLLLFVATLPGASMVRCAGGPCLGGSIAYVPALIMLAVVGGVLAHRRHGAAPALLAAAGLFFVSLALRTLDRPICPLTAITAVRMTGTHVLWHICNGLLLFVLLLTALRHGHPPLRRT